ncbi:MAG: AAA family ATPase [Lachnospiraceae bacterium]|nr:AAA family ATPase [Lachnospiraceae bacterium]
MINIFRNLDNAGRQKNRPLGDRQSGSSHAGVSEYILRHLSAVCPGEPEDWEDMVIYIEMLYFRVIEDASIKPEARSLSDMLDKLEDDLAYSKEIFGKRAGFVLDFLEADLLRGSIKNGGEDDACLVIGKIVSIRMRYFGHKKDKCRINEKMYPTEIKYYLDTYIIGQNDAKVAIANAVYGHGKRVRHPDVRFAPDVVLLIGPSGCGKSEIMRRIKELTGYPMVFTDVSNLGASQYRGRHKEDILYELYEAAGKDKKLAEKGIVFMDEFDKLLLPAVSEKGINVHDDVQSQLLTMLEGSDVELKNDGQSLVLNTSKMLFVLAGAFQGIDEFIKADKMKKEKVPGNMGFLSPLSKDMDLELVRDNINHEVLMNYGMKRELAGRICSIAVLEKLKLEDMIRILKEPKDNLIERYAREIKLSSGAELCFDDSAITAIAETAMKMPVGARALQSIVGDIMMPVLYRAPGIDDLKKIIINRDVVEGKAAAEYITSEGESLEGMILEGYGEANAGSL